MNFFKSLFPSSQTKDSSFQFEDSSSSHPQTSFQGNPQHQPHLQDPHIPPNGHDSSFDKKRNYLRSQARRVEIADRMTLQRAQSLAYHYYDGHYIEVLDLIDNLTKQISDIKNQFQDHLASCSSNHLPSDHESSPIKHLERHSLPSTTKIYRNDSSPPPNLPEKSTIISPKPKGVRFLTSSILSTYSNGQNNQVYNERLRINRQYTHSDLPANTCAIVSALDLTVKTKWVKNTASHVDPAHPIVQLINLPNTTNARNAIESVFQLEGHPLNPKGEKQDPWLAIQNIQKWILSATSTESLRLPALSCACGTTSQFLEYGRSRNGRYEFSNKCQNCNENLKLLHLPQEFLVRIETSSKSTFQTKTPNPRFDSHFVTAAIQFDDEKQHFRFLKSINRNTIQIYDGNCATRISGDGIKNEQLFNSNWKNYILVYTALSGYEIPDIQVQPKFPLRKPILLGGSSKPESTITFPPSSFIKYARILSRIPLLYTLILTLNGTSLQNSSAPQEISLPRCTLQLRKLSNRLDLNPLQISKFIIALYRLLISSIGFALQYQQTRKTIDSQNTPKVSLTINTNLTPNVIQTCSIVSSIDLLNVTPSHQQFQKILSASCHLHPPSTDGLLDAWLSLQACCSILRINSVFIDLPGHTTRIVGTKSQQRYFVRYLHSFKNVDNQISPNNKGFIIFDIANTHFYYSAGHSGKQFRYITEVEPFDVAPPPTIFNTHILALGGANSRINQHLRRSLNKANNYQSRDIRDYFQTQTLTTSLESLRQAPPSMDPTQQSMPNEEKKPDSFGFFAWNVRGFGSRTLWRQKTTVIRSTNPTICLLNELYTAKIKIPGMCTINATPAPIASQERSPKLNASICYLQSLQSTTITQQINYISTFLTGYPLHRPTLVISFYLNPHTDPVTSNLNEKVLDLLSNDISSTDFANSDVIIYADFNLTLEKMKNHSHEVFSRILQLNHLQPLRNPSRHGGNRVIDHLFTTLPTTHTLLEIPDLSYLSDHYPLNLQSPAGHPPLPAIIPNKHFDFKVSSHLISLKIDCPQESVQTLKRKAISLTLNEGHKKTRKIRNRKPITGPCKELTEAVQQPNFIHTLNSKLKTFTENIISDRFSSASKRAFSNLKKLTKYNTFEKRDGSIMTSATIQDRIISGQQLQRLLSEHYRDAHTTLPDPNPEEIKFPDLPTSTNTIALMCQNIKANKAGAFDHIHQILFKLCNPLRSKCQLDCKFCLGKLSILKAYLEPSFWSNPQHVQKHFSCRLIPLNKSHPHIPPLSNYRPIVVTSPLVKFLEGGILPQLKQYQYSRLNKQQIGFVPGCSIDMGKQQVINILENYKTKKKNAIATFIDFSGAYDKVDRTILYNLIQQKNILQPHTLQLLQFIHQNIRISVGSNSISTTTGVPQGLTSSPAAFDIITEPLLQKLISNNTECIMYADDLVFFSESPSHLQKNLEILTSWSSQNNMSLNPRKSGHMLFPFDPDHPINPQDFTSMSEIPIVETYKYLGSYLQSNLGFSQHISNIDRKLTFLHARLTPIRNVNNLRLNLNLFRIFALPLFRLYLCNYSSLQGQQKQQVMKSLRKHLKKFLNLPINTSTQTLEQITGNFAKELNFQHQIIVVKTERHFREKYLLNPFIPKPKKTVWPSKLIPTLQTMYSSKCRDHHFILNSDHLVTHHALPCIRGIIRLIKNQDTHQIGCRQLDIFHESIKNIAKH